MEGVRFPRIDVARFRKAFVHNRVKRTLHEFLEALGPERIEWIVANRRPLSALAPPAMERKYRALGPNYVWVSDLISDEEFASMLPEWVLEILDRHGAEAQAWFREQLVWLRGFFVGRGLFARR